MIVKENIMALLPTRRVAENKDIILKVQLLEVYM